MSNIKRPISCVADFLFDMAMRKIELLARNLEDASHPLLGPTIKGLIFIGLLQTGTRFRKAFFNFFHCVTTLFVVTEFIQLYIVRHDINQALMNISLILLGVICVTKLLSTWICQNRWRSLMENVSLEEKRQLEKQDEKIVNIMEDYKIYTRLIAYLYWPLIIFTNSVLTLTPLVKYVMSKNYREDLRSGVEPLPQIMFSWFPFDNSKTPGYFFGYCFHTIMACYGSAIIGTFDMTALSIMIYLKGQMRILKEKCTTMFDDVHLSDQDLIEKMKEVHRHHNVLIAQHRRFNALLSPSMFVYVFSSSISICCSVVQFKSRDASFSQKWWAIQYSTGLVLQLFLYCWHGNEVTEESKAVDMGVYESQWWRVNKRTRRQVLLLAGKLNHTFVLNAGPLATLSVPTFISILKGSYSFFTLFSQMQD